MYTAVPIDEDGSAATPVPIFQRRRPLGAALGAVFVLMIGVGSTIIFREQEKGPLSLTEDTTEVLKVSNAYERMYGRQIGDGVRLKKKEPRKNAFTSSRRTPPDIKIKTQVYPHDYLVAVMKPTKLSLHSGNDADWLVRNEADGSFSELASGASEATFVFKDAGTTRVRAVRAKDGKAFDFAVDARIVRYELRDLNEEDREKYFSA